MNDSALKSFCTWARTELIKGVEAQMVRYGITEPAPVPVGLRDRQRPAPKSS